MAKAPEYPKGTQFGNYILCQDSPGKFSIRRQITLPDGERRQPRYPKSEYKHLTSEAEITALVNRLNHRQDEKRKLEEEVRSSFIPQRLKDEFRDQLKLEIPNGKDFRYQYNKVFQVYFLRYFTHTLKVLDPNQWYQHQSQWGAALLGQADNPEHNIFGSKKMSFKTISRTIQIANRFMALLHVKNPDEYKKIEFEPISLGAQKAYEAKRKLASKEAGGIGKFIDAKDWKAIVKKLPDDIKPAILLAYNYGLRRAEALGFENMEAVKKGYLRVTQQLVAIDADKICFYGPVKDRDRRDTPHWFCKPAEAYNLISQILTRKMHSDTLGQRWSDFMTEMGMDYGLHDLRRTFITRALRKYNPRDVQLAVGHASLTTTMGYAMDDRGHSDEIYTPRVSS